MPPTADDDIEIRELRTAAERDACVQLQRETWGASFSDVVPTSILQVTQRVGGVCAGAFDRGGALVGFVYGITGVERGEVVHWSDMLAVRPGMRGRGIARRLKEHQRTSVARHGARTIYWTYDPLVARNAHLNFNVFGVRVVEYVEDMYGDTASALHRGIGTDRLVVAWPVGDEEARAQRDANHAAGVSAPLLGAPVVNANGAIADPATWESLDALRIEIPADIHEVLGASPGDAARWRATTRAAFRGALASGFSVAGFVADPCTRRGAYLLSR